jgi:hypothetical protein
MAEMWKYQYLAQKMQKNKTWLAKCHRRGIDGDDPGPNRFDSFRVIDRDPSIPPAALELDDEKRNGWYNKVHEV